MSAQPIAIGYGQMPDICAIPNGWIVCYRVPDGPLTVARLTRRGAVVWQQKIAVGSPEGALFARLMVIQGALWLAYPAFRDGAWWAIVRTFNADGRFGDELRAGGLYQPSDHPYGNSPVCLSSDGWFAWQDADTMTVEGLFIPTGERRTLRGDVRPTGLARCDAGVVVFVDDIRTRPDMANPVTAGSCTVGEGYTGGIAVAFVGGPSGVLMPGVDTFVPRVADGGSDEYGAVSWNNTGAFLVVFGPNDLAPVQTPEPTPQPDPVPQPQPEPTQVPDIPSQQDLVARIRAKYPRSNPGSSPLGEDAWRCIVDIAQQLKAQVFRKEGGERAFIPAGMLPNFPNGVGINRTIVGRGAFGNQWVKVLGDGEGTAFPKWETGDTPADGEYIDVSGIVLEPQPTPNPNPNPTPNPTPDPEPPPSTDVDARLTRLEARYDMLVSRIRQFGAI